jgi:hypothetical protein
LRGGLHDGGQYGIDLTTQFLQERTDGLPENG